MERLSKSQRELHWRIARTDENLRKAGTTNINDILIRSALTVLEKKWAKFEAQHDRLNEEYGELLEEHTYTTEDFLTTVEMEYLQQRT